MNILQDGVRETGKPSKVPGWLEVGGAWGLRVVFLAAAIGVVLFILFQLRVAVLPIFVAILVSTLVAPIAHLFRKWKLPRALASALAVLLCLGVLVGAGILIGVAVSGEFDQLGVSAKRGYQQVVEQAAQVMNVDSSNVTGWVDDHLSSQSFPGLTKTAVSQVKGILEGFTILALGVVFTFLFSWDGDEQFDNLVRLLPAPRREGTRELGRRIWTSVGGYMRGMFLIAAADALLLGIGYWIIGMPLVLPLMLLMFLGAFVPFLGPLIAASTAALVGVAEGELGMAALAIGIAFLVQQIEGNLLHPLLMGRAVRLHPAVILFSVTAGGVLGGIAGIFLAIPVATTAATTFWYLRERAE